MILGTMAMTSSLLARAVPGFMAVAVPAAVPCTRQSLRSKRLARP